MPGRTGQLLAGRVNYQQDGRISGWEGGTPAGTKMLFRAIGLAPYYSGCKPRDFHGMISGINVI